MRALGGREAVAAAAAGAVVTATLVVIALQNRTAEDHLWEGVFSAASASGIWCSPLGSYRPVCGSVVLAMAPWPAVAALYVGYLAHLVAVALGAWLALRITGSRRAAVYAAAVPLVWATQLEVTLWMGGRCELLWTIPGLLGAHLVLRGLREDRLLDAIGAALMVGVAGLAKEPGVLLPLAWIPLAGAIDPLPSRRVLARQLGPAFIAAAAIVGLRMAVSRGPSPYVVHHLIKGPVDWAGNLALGVTKLALGTIVDWPNAVGVITPLVVGGLVLAALIRARDRRAWVFALAFAAVVAPTALVHAPRTLYGAVAMLGVGAGVLAWRAPRWRGPIAAAVVLHAGLTLSSQRIWVEVIARRDALEQRVIASTEDKDHVYLVGMRARPMGLLAGATRYQQMSARSAWPVLPAWYDENALDPLRPAELVEAGDCRAVVATERPPGQIIAPDEVTLLDEGEDRWSITAAQPFVLVLGREGAPPRFVRVPCAAVDGEARDAADADGDAAPRVDDREPADHEDLAPRVDDRATAEDPEPATDSD